MQSLEILAKQLTRQRARAIRATKEIDERGLLVAECREGNSGAEVCFPFAIIDPVTRECAYSARAEGGWLGCNTLPNRLDEEEFICLIQDGYLDETWEAEPNTVGFRFDRLIW